MKTLNQLLYGFLNRMHRLLTRLVVTDIDGEPVIRGDFVGQQGKMFALAFRFGTHGQRERLEGCEKLP